MHHLGPRGSAELGAGTSEQENARPVGGEPDRQPAAHVVVHAQHPDDRGRLDGGFACLVVEADVPAGDGHAKHGAAVGEAADRLGELPHHRRVLGRTEVQAVRHGQRPGAGRGHVAVRLAERELRSRVRVEQRVAAVAVGGQRHTQPGFLIDTYQPAVLGHGQDGVAAHVAVVLLGHPGLVREAGRAKQGQQRGAQAAGPGRARQRGGVGGGQLVLPAGPGQRAGVHGPLVRGGAGRDVDDRIALPGHLEPTGAGHLTDDRGLHAPPRADAQEPGNVARLDDRHHALLRLAHQDFRWPERRVAQRHGVEPDPHAAAAGRGELGGGAGHARRAEILNARHQAVTVELEAALDQQLLQERVAHLDAGPLGRVPVTGPAEGRAGQDRRAADAVGPGPRAEQYDLVAGPVGGGQLEVPVPHHPDA